MREHRWSALIVAACLLGAPCVAFSQAAPHASMPPTSRPAVTLMPPPSGPTAWSSLSASQQRMLAPVHGQWDQLQPKRQQRLAHNAQHWAMLPPERQEQIRQRLSRWAEMTPAQRRQLHDNARTFHQLTPAERAKVSAAYKRFQSLSPAERRALRERWRTQPQQQRKHGAGSR